MTTHTILLTATQGDNSTTRTAACTEDEARRAVAACRDAMAARLVREGYAEADAEAEAELAITYVERDSFAAHDAYPPETDEPNALHDAAWWVCADEDEANAEAVHAAIVAAAQAD